MLKITCLTGKKEFSSIKNEWDTFVTKHFPESYWLDHGWLANWWECYAKDDEAFVFLAYEGDVLAGIIPLILQNENYSGFPVKRLGFMGKGFGKEDFPVVTSTPDIAKALFDEIEKRSRWDIAYFMRLGGESYGLLKDESDRRKMKYEDIDIQNPVIELKGSYKEYFDSRSKNFRANYRKKSKRINEWGTMRIEYAEKPDLQMIIGTIEAIGKDSWQGEKGVSLAAYEAGRMFLNELVRNFIDRGILDITFLYLNDEPIAYLLGARCNKTYFAIETAYKEKYFDVSPGMLLHLRVLERLYEYGNIELMDLGYDAEYKRRWTDLNRPEKQIVIYNRKIYSKMIHSVRKSPIYSRVLAIKKKIS